MLKGNEKSKQNKNIARKMFYYLLKLTGFYEMFFLSSEIKSSFFGNRQLSDARAGQKKKHMFFFLTRGLNLMRPLI